MNKKFASEQELREYLREHSDGFLGDAEVREICSFAYKTDKARKEACIVLTEYIRRHDFFPVYHLYMIAGFLESANYTAARQFLIKHRNRLEPDIKQGDHGLMVLSKNAKMAWAALNNAVKKLSEVEISRPTKRSLPGSKRFDVFLSYSRLDEEPARELFERLVAAGFRVYFAKKVLAGGDNFSEEIRQALLDSFELWVLITPNSLKSEWVATEWGAGWALGKRVVPVLLRCRPEKLPDRLRILQCVDYHDSDTLMEQLMKRVGRKSNHT